MNLEKRYVTMSVDIVPAPLSVSGSSVQVWCSDLIIRIKGGYEMEQRESFQFDCQLHKKEVREMSLRMTLDSFFHHKPFILVVSTWMIAAIFLTFIDMVMGHGWGSLITRAAPMLIIIVVILLLTHLLTYRTLVKNGMLNAGRISLENGYVKMGITEAFVSPASGYTRIIKGRTVILLGTKSSNRITNFIGIPRRVFTSDEELDSFLAALRHSKIQEGGDLDEREENQKCDFLLTFEVTQEQWLRIYDETMRFLNSTSSGKRRKGFVTAGIGVLIASTMAVTMYIKRYSLMEAMLVMIIFIVVMGLLIISLHFQKSDVMFRKWMEKGLMPMEAIGQWEIGIRPEGCYTLHNGTYLRIKWSEYRRCYEIKDTMYFYDQNLKRYLFIPKESLGGEEGQERFFAYFRQLGMEFAKVDL